MAYFTAEFLTAKMQWAFNERNFFFFIYSLPSPFPCKYPDEFTRNTFRFQYFFKHKTVKTNDKIRRFGVVMTALSREI